MINANYQSRLKYTLLLFAIVRMFLIEMDVLAKPSYQNGYSDCPPQSDTIWVRIDPPNTPRIEVGGNIIIYPNPLYREIPFDTGSVTYQENIGGQVVSVQYQNYVKGVLTGELNNGEPIAGGNSWQPEMLKALAIAIRSIAYNSCGEITADGIHRGIRGQTIQEYRYAPIIPGTFYNVSPQTQQDFQNAIDATEDVYMHYQLDTFGVQYRDRTGLYTFGDTLPHISVYDPVGLPFDPIQKSGLAQINTNYWALGDSQGTSFPDWNHPQILTHYYTDIGLLDFPFNLRTPVYRWNPLTVDWGNSSLVPPQMARGGTYNVDIELQNTGTILSWNNSTKLTYRWLFPSGEPVMGATGEIDIPNVTTFGQGSSTQPGVPLTLPVQAPNQLGQYTLIIDMFQPTFQRPGYFALRQEGLPWYDLRYENVSVVNECTVSSCQNIYLPLVLKSNATNPSTCQNYLKNGSFDDGLNNWIFVFGVRDTSAETECTADNPPVVVSAIKAARLGRCDNNFDLLSQFVVLPTDHNGAMYLYVDWVVATLEADPPVDGITDQFQISIDDGIETKVIKLVGSEFGYSDGDGDGVSDWQSLTYDLQSYDGKTIELKFLGFNDPYADGPNRDPTDFFIDNVAVNICD